MIANCRFFCHVSEFFNNNFYLMFIIHRKFMRQLGFEYINGEYRSHAADDSFRFDSNHKIIKIMLIRKAQLDKIIAGE